MNITELNQKEIAVVGGGGEIDVAKLICVLIVGIVGTIQVSSILVGILGGCWYMADKTGVSDFVKKQYNSYFSAPTEQQQVVEQPAN